MLILVVCASLVPSVQAAQPDNQTIVILKDVIGINTDNYSASDNFNRSSEFLNSPEKVTDIKLTSEQSSLRVTATYIESTLKLVYLSDINGKLPLKQSTNSNIPISRYK